MKTYINVLFGTKQQQQCKKVIFVYGDADNPTISDVKAVARAQLHAALEGCSVKVQMPNNTTATLSDTEQFSSDDNIWIDATDTSKRTKTSTAATVSDEVFDSTEDSPSDESLAYTLTYQETTVTLFRRNTYLEWNTVNNASIKLLYHMAKPQTDLKLGNTSIYDYFDATMTRGLIVLVYYRNAVPNIAVLEDAKRRLRNRATDMAFTAFKTNDYTTQAKLTTQLLNSWLKTNFMPFWSAAGCDSPIAQALTSRGYRDRKTSGIRKSKSMKFKTSEATLNAEAFSTVLEGMMTTTDDIALQHMYKTTASIRRPWLTVMLHASDSFEDAIDTFFDELPFLSENLSWLHYDFTECMQEKYDKIPNFGTTLTAVATAIISTAKQLRLPNQIDDDIGLYAANAVIHLINKYCKEICKMDSILMRDTNGRNENDLLRLKNAITIKPMIVMTSDNDGRKYYIALQRQMLKLQNSDFSAVLQLYMELFYIFDLAYDSSIAPFFEFFSLIEGINKTPKATLANFMSTLQFVYDKIHSTIEEETSASITKPHSDNDNRASQSNVDNGTTQS